MAVQILQEQRLAWNSIRQGRLKQQVGQIWTSRFAGGFNRPSGRGSWDRQAACILHQTANLPFLGEPAEDLPGSPLGYLVASRKHEGERLIPARYRLVRKRISQYIIHKLVRD